MLHKIAEELQKKSRPIEYALFLLVLAGLFMKTQHLPFAGFLLTLSLSSLSVVYFILSHATPVDKENVKMSVFTNRLLFWGLSIASIGILFKIQNWPSANMFLVLGSITIVATTFVRIRLQLIVTLFRIVIVLGLAAALYFSSEQKLMELNIHHTKIEIPN